jgi:hypothetical protein
VILADGTVVLKGAVDAIVAALDGEAPPELKTLSDEISSLGATPLAIRRNGRRSASSSSRTRSSPASRNASTSCAGWASGPSWSPATTR